MSSLTGTGQLARLILRRDRVIMAIWISLLVLIPISFVSAITGLYPTLASRQELASTVGLTPVFVAFYGPIYDTSIGALVAWRTGIVPIVLAVISLLTVIRHTRTEEEAGRRELVGSGVVGRESGLGAALMMTIGANLVLAVLIGFGMMSKNLPAEGSFALGLQYAAVGCVFAALGAVAAQLTNRAGTARAMCFAALGVAFFLRLAGDVTSFKWLLWLSPIGWAEQIHAYGAEQWWIFIPVIALVAALSYGASQLLKRRDIGSGLLPSKPGPAAASPEFRTPLALAWRLQRNLLIGWAAGLALMGVALGGVASSLTSLINASPQFQQVIAKLGGSAGLVDAYFAGTLEIFALVAAGYAVQSALKMRSEELEQRAEPVLATAVGRLRWAASHLWFAFAGPAVVLAAVGLAAGLVAGLTGHDLAHQLTRVLAGALVQLPAVWVLVGLAVALYGWLPRWTGVSWGVLGLIVMVLIMGAVVNLPQWALDISPFTHIPKIPGGSFRPEPMIILLAVAAALTAAGLIGFKRRDFGRV